MTLPSIRTCRPGALAVDLPLCRLVALVLLAVGLAAGETATVVQPVPVAAVRQLGTGKASATVDLVLDINCLHCAEVFSPTMLALQHFAAAGAIDVTVRWWPRPREVQSTDLISHILAAPNATEFRLLSSLVVGTPAGRDWQFLRPRLAELIEPSIVERRYEANREAIAGLLAEDAAFVKRWSLRHVPTIILQGRDGTLLGRWEGLQVDLELITKQFATLGTAVVDAR